jgi:hypothetical protein
MWLALTSSVNGALRREPDRVNKTYARLIGRTFIDPLIDPGTDASKRLFSWNSLTVEDTSLVSRGQLGDDLVVAGPHRPFLIAGGTVIVSRRDSDYPLLMPIEYTPMYVGIRHRFSPRYGGIYVSPWMYDATQIGEVKDDGTNHFLSVRRDKDRPSPWVTWWAAPARPRSSRWSSARSSRFHSASAFSDSRKCSRRSITHPQQRPGPQRRDRRDRARRRRSATTSASCRCSPVA